MAKNVKKDKYYIKLVESSSPLSKMPSTPFRLATLGLLEQEACRVQTDTTSVGDEDTSPSELPVLPSAAGNGMTCEAVVDPSAKLVAKVNQFILIPIDHGSNVDKLTGVEYKGEDGITVQLNKGEVFIKGSTVGSFTVRIVIYYDDCPVCKLDIPFTVESEPSSPTDPPTEPDPITPNPNPGGCMPEDPTPPTIEVPSGSVTKVGRSCDTIFEEGKVEEYVNMSTFKWKLVEGGRDIDTDLKDALGDENVTFEGMPYWYGLSVLLQMYFSEEVELMQAGEKEYLLDLEAAVLGFVDLDIAEDWTTFHDSAYKNYGITDCASSTDKASLWMTSKLGVVCVIDEEGAWVAESPVLETMVEKFSEIYAGDLVNLIRVRDVFADQGSAVTGAFVSDQPVINEVLGVLNIEPQLEMYNFDSYEAFFPVDYKHNSPTSEWLDAVYDIPEDYMQFHYDTASFTDMEKKALVSSAVVYHELAHALDNRYRDFKGKTISELDDFRALSGWTEGGKMTKTEFGLVMDSVKPPITAYGCYSPGEDFAEAYMMYKYNPKFLCFYHPAKYDYIKAREKELFELMGKPFIDNGYTCEECEYTEPTDPPVEPVEPSDCGITLNIDPIPIGTSTKVVGVVTDGVVNTEFISSEPSIVEVREEGENIYLDGKSVGSVVITIRLTLDDGSVCESYFDVEVEGEVTPEPPVIDPNAPTKYYLMMCNDGSGKKDVCDVELNGTVILDNEVIESNGIHIFHELTSPTLKEGSNTLKTTRVSHESEIWFINVYKSKRDLSEGIPHGGDEMGLEFVASFKEYPNTNPEGIILLSFNATLGGE